MGQPSRAFKAGTIMWSVLIAIAVLALTVSIFLPSTKRARMDFKQYQQMKAEHQAAMAAEAAAAAATQPSSGPATQPGAPEDPVED